MGFLPSSSFIICPRTTRRRDFVFSLVRKQRPFTRWRLWLLLVLSSTGTSIVPFQKKRLTHLSGWMALIPNANHINWYFRGVEHLTNISYTSTFYGFKVNEELQRPEQQPAPSSSHTHLFPFPLLSVYVFVCEFMYCGICTYV